MELEGITEWGQWKDIYTDWYLAYVRFKDTPKGSTKGQKQHSGELVHRTECAIVVVVGVLKGKGPWWRKLLLWWEVWGWKDIHIKPTINNM